MTTVPDFDYELASDLDGALAAVGSGATPIHGGTELLPAMAYGVMAPERVVSLRAIADLKQCRVTGDRLMLGSGMTHRDIARHPIVRAHAPVLAEVAAGVGNIRVRSTGTLGGNIAFAEPRSDVLITLAALGATVDLASTTAQRSQPFGDFLLGPFEVDIRPGELIVSVSLDTADARQAVYRKIVRSERPVVGCCVARLRDGRWRLVIGAATLMPTITEADDLAGFDIEAITKAIDPTEDLGGSAAYKRHLSRVVAERCRDAAAALEGTGTHE